MNTMLPVCNLLPLHVSALQFMCLSNVVCSMRRGVHIQDRKKIKNLTTDWNDGTVIAALVDAIAPGLMPDWNELDPENAVENATRAMKLAEDWLGVPMVRVLYGHQTNASVFQEIGQFALVMRMYFLHLVPAHFSFITVFSVTKTPSCASCEREYVNILQAPTFKNSVN